MRDGDPMSEQDLCTLLTLFKRERKKMIPIVAAISAMGGGLITAGATFINWHDKNRDSAAHEIKQDQDIVAIRTDVDQTKSQVSQLSSDVKLLVRSMQDDQTNAKEFREFVRERWK
jgi:hypothetical protein